jgi:hypothetical protein
VSICVFFDALCVTLGHLGSYLSLCYSRLSAFRVGTYLSLFEVICIESISALYLSSVGLVELLLLVLHLSVSVVLRFVSTQAHPLFCW